MSLKTISLFDSCPSGDSGLVVFIPCGVFNKNKQGKYYVQTGIIVSRSLKQAKYFWPKYAIRKVSLPRTACIDWGLFNFPEIGRLVFIKTGFTNWPV